MSLQIVLIIVGCIVIVSIYISAKMSVKRDTGLPPEKTPSNENGHQTDIILGEDSSLPPETRGDYSQLDLLISAKEKQLGLFESIQKISQNSNDENTNSEERLVGEAEEEEEDHTLVKIYIRPTKGEVFKGPDVLRALNHVGMSYGLMNIFHKEIEMDGKKSHTLFSAADMFEPGTFNLQTIEAERSKGLVFFMHTPTILDDGVALEKFLSAAKQVSNTLGGQLYKNPTDILDNDYLDALRLKTNFIIENE